MKRATRRCGLAVMVFGLVAGAAGQADAGQTLWYNGDLSDSGLINTINSTSGNHKVFDDFTISDIDGWTITSIWSNNTIHFSSIDPIAQAQWSIRTGMSAVNAGTIVASGTSAATQTITGRNLFGTNPEYRVEVSGLSIDLGPGTYWLQVTPLVSGLIPSYVSTTGGANAVGTPSGNNMNSFHIDPAGVVRSTSFYYEGVTRDFSMGVAGDVNGAVVTAPEPSTLAMGCTAVVLGLGYGWRKRRKAAGI